MLSKQGGRRDHLAVKHRAGWLIRYAENASLQARVELKTIEVILAMDAGHRNGRETDASFEPRQFFGGAPFEFSIH
jgi:hypothetical protein